VGDLGNLESSDRQSGGDLTGSVKESRKNTSLSLKVKKKNLGSRRGRTKGRVGRYLYNCKVSGEEGSVEKISVEQTG